MSFVALVGGAIEQTHNSTCEKSSGTIVTVATPTIGSSPLLRTKMKPLGVAATVPEY